MCVSPAGSPLPASPPAAPVARAPGASVVVADDHDVFRRGLVRALDRRPDLTVVAAVADGTAALIALRAHHPCVAVLDLRMPQLDGLQVLGRLAADPALVDTPVVVLSADLTPQATAAVLAAGAVVALDKASSRRTIGDAVAAAAGGTRSAPGSS